MERPKDWFWLELFAVLASLVAGAALRYWLSTVVPFDAVEIVVLEDATDPESAMRVPFIMMNGISLLAVYVLARRSLGIGPALAIELALQASLTFQHEALRVRLWAPAILIALVVATYFRLGRPAWRVPDKWNIAGIVLAGLLGLKQLYHLASLPAQLPKVRAGASADIEPLRQALAGCGGSEEVAFDAFRSCSIPWPQSRSLEQQESLWEHQRRLGKDAIAVHTAAQIPQSLPGPHVALLDREGAGFIVVPVGPLRVTARRVVLSSK